MMVILAFNNLNVWQGAEYDSDGFTKKRVSRKISKRQILLFSKFLGRYIGNLFRI